MSKQLIVFFLAVFSINCDNYVPLQPIDTNQNKLVLMAKLSMQDGLTVKLSQTLAVTDTILISPDLFINDALVLFYENEILIDTLINKENGNYTFSKPFQSLTENSYHLIVQTTDFETLTTEKLTMPDTVNFQILDEVAPDYNGVRKFSFSFTDDGTMSNFYMVKAYLQTANNFETINVGTSYLFEDASCGFGDAILPDYCFNGETIELFAQLSDKEDSSYYYLGLESISESFYLHYKNTVYEEYDAFESIFLAPSLYYSNIEGGYGLFSVHNEKRKKVIE